MSAIRRFSSRVRRLYRRVLLRPLPALLLFGSLTAVSNWLWYGGGPFLARGVGAALMLAFALAAAAVLLAAPTVRRRLVSAGRAVRVS